MYIYTKTKNYSYDNETKKFRCSTLSFLYILETTIIFLAPVLEVYSVQRSTGTSFDSLGSIS